MILAEIRSFKFVTDGKLDKASDEINAGVPIEEVFNKYLELVMKAQEPDPYELDKIEINLSSKFSDVDLCKAVCAAYFDLIRKEIEKNESIIRL